MKEGEWMKWMKWKEESHLRSSFIVSESDVDAKESNVIVVTIVILVLDVVHVFVVLLRKKDWLDGEAVETRYTLTTFLKKNIGNACQLIKSPLNMIMDNRISKIIVVTDSDHMLPKK